MDTFLPTLLFWKLIKSQTTTTSLMCIILNTILYHGVNHIIEVYEIKNGFVSRRPYFLGFQISWQKRDFSNFHPSAMYNNHSNSYRNLFPTAIWLLHSQELKNNFNSKSSLKEDVGRWYFRRNPIEYFVWYINYAYVYFKENKIIFPFEFARWQQ